MGAYGIKNLTRDTCTGADRRTEGRRGARRSPPGIFGLPGDLLVLQDGRLLCTYDRRTAPFGVRACISENGGRTWQVEQEMVIRNDLPNSDLGYPTTIEYSPGHLFVYYYGQGLDGVTCIQGTHVTMES